MTSTAHQCPAKIAHTGCSMAVQGCLRLSLEAFNGCANAKKYRALKGLPKTRQHLFYTRERFLSLDPRRCTGRVYIRIALYKKLLPVNIRAPDEVDHDLVEDQALDAEGLADLREDLVVAPVAKGPVLERADLEDLVVQRAESLLLEVDDGHDEVATLHLREGHRSLETGLHGGSVVLVLGAQADLLVDCVGQVLHAETAQLAGPLGSDRSRGNT